MFDHTLFPTLKVWLLATIAVLAGFFAPIHVLLTCVAVIVMMDFVLGIGASIKRKIPVTSNRMRKTISKFIAYLGGLLLLYVINHGIIGDEIPLTGGMATIIGLAEASSCMENLSIITGQENLFGSILAKINKLSGSDGSHKTEE